LWIQQRLEEEIDQRGDTKASVREIGRLVAAEIERVFETKIDPGTIYQKARRMEAGTNLPPETTTCNNTENSGVQGGAKIALKNTSQLVEQEIKKARHLIPALIILLKPVSAHYAPIFNYPQRGRLTGLFLDHRNFFAHVNNKGILNTAFRPRYLLNKVIEFNKINTFHKREQDTS